MCYSAGSINQAVNPCPMCKVYSHTKCPHIRDTCRNRAAHPRMDVLYLKNAEVESFNGCGFCKWANMDPPPKQSGYNNPGWPGCCRAPYANECDKIQAADWPAVSIVHRVPIPTEIEAILKFLPLPPLPFRASNGQPSSPTNRSTLSSKPSTPTGTIRKSSGANTPSNKSSILSTKPMNMPSIGRGRQGSITPGSHHSRSASTTAISSSVPSASSIESPARRRAAQTTDRRAEGSHSTHSSPSRKSLDLENPVTPRRVSSVRRPTVTPATTSVSLSKVVAADTRSPESRLHDGASRRGSTASASSPSATSQSRLGEGFIIPRSSKEDDDCRSSSSGSSDGMGSLSDSTVTSDGGFTDYLSDESEAELQRQAEAKAAVVAQNQQEELEFKMARQQLTHVGLKPPKSWTQTNTPPVSPTKSPTTTPNASPMPPSRSANVPTQSFAAAAAIMHTGQARG